MIACFPFAGPSSIVVLQNVGIHNLWGNLTSLYIFKQEINFRNNSLCLTFCDFIYKQDDLISISDGLRLKRSSLSF